MKVKIVPIDEYDFHEAMDRTAIVSAQLDRLLLNHRGVKNHKKAHNLIEQASKNLSEAYHLLGEQFFNKIEK